MIVLGHRGGRGVGWPAENTLEAFQRALDEGADGVELDVRLCASGEVVVVHDPSLSRVTYDRDTRGIHAVRRAELPRLEGGLKIPLLAEALDLCRDRIVNIEIKPDVPEKLALVRAVVREVGRGARAAPSSACSTKIVISSFDPSIVLASAFAAPRIARAMLIGPRTPRLSTILPRAMRRAIVAAHLYDPLISAARIERLDRSGLRSVAWTVNSASRARELAEAGVDWLITDQPAAIIAALSGNG